MDIHAEQQMIHDDQDQSADKRKGNEHDRDYDPGAFQKINDLKPELLFLFPG
jgi:hypothetical protein